MFAKDQSQIHNPDTSRSSQPFVQNSDGDEDNDDGWQYELDTSEHTKQAPPEEMVQVLKDLCLLIIINAFLSRILRIAESKPTTPEGSRPQSRTTTPCTPVQFPSRHSPLTPSSHHSSLAPKGSIPMSVRRAPNRIRVS